MHVHENNDPLYSCMGQLYNYTCTHGFELTNIAEKDALIILTLSVRRIPLAEKDTLIIFTLYDSTSGNH